MSSETKPVPFVQPGDTLESFLRSFWTRQISMAEDGTPDFKHPPLPLARIKKVMKSDPDVKMISADAPILFAKACEIFITEMTARAWIIAESNKRRTLSRADIARAMEKSDQFDFLIDIVPREEATAGKRRATGSNTQQASGSRAGDTSPTLAASTVAYSEHLSNDGGQTSMTHTFSAHPGHIEEPELEDHDSLPNADQASELLHTLEWALGNTSHNGSSGV